MSALRPLADRLPAWIVRATFGAAFFVFGEVMLWSSPDPARWPARALGCLLLAALVVDLIVRFNARDVPSLAVAGGLFGAPYGVLVAQAVGDNLLGGDMLLRTLGWYALIGGGLGILTVLVILRGAAFTPGRAGAAVGLGLLWGMWARWFPAQLEGGAPAPLEAATVAAGVGLAAVGALALACGRNPPRYEINLMLTRGEWALVLGGLAIFLVAGLAAGAVTLLGLGALAVLVGFLVSVLMFSRRRYRRSVLREVIPPAALNVPHYAALALSFLIAAGIGYIIPPIGSAEAPAQITAMMTVLFVVGFAWVPTVSIVMAVRGFADITQQEG